MAIVQPRFLIDENLAPNLVEIARSGGFEAMHVNHLGLRTKRDWTLLRVVEGEDWILVTNNALEFRGRYRKISIHPGVVFLLPSVRIPEQTRLFATAIEKIRRHPDMVNKALDVSFDDGGQPVATLHDLP